MWRWCRHVKRTAPQWRGDPRPWLRLTWWWPQDRTDTWPAAAPQWATARWTSCTVGSRTTSASPPQETTAPVRPAWRPSGQVEAAGILVLVTSIPIIRSTTVLSHSCRSFEGGGLDTCSCMETVYRASLLCLQCPAHLLVSQWMWTVRPALPPCPGETLWALWGISPAPNRWMGTLCTVTPRSPLARSRTWNVATFTTSPLKPLTASATAPSVHLWRWEQVNIKPPHFATLLRSYRVNIL